MEITAHTFKHKIKYSSKQMTASGWGKGKVEKEVTFDELDETIKAQHRLHFKIVSLYTAKPSDDTSEVQVKIDTDTMYDITVEAIKILAHTDENFTEVDLKEFLADSLAILKFGRWFMGEHLVPFIVEYNS